jgi:hypothetical protein
VPSGCNVARGRERTDQLGGVQNQTRYFAVRSTESIGRASKPHAKPCAQSPTSEWSCGPPEASELSYRSTDTERILVPRGRRAILTGDLASRSGITKVITRGTAVVTSQIGWMSHPPSAAAELQQRQSERRNGHQSSTHPRRVELFQSSIP